jgi:hypothetical protein
MPQQSDDELPQYDGSRIEIVSLPEAVRSRPTMYLGSTDQRALHHLLAAFLEGLRWHYQILQTSLDHMTICLELDGSATMTCRGATPSSRFLEQNAQTLVRDLQPIFRQRPYLVIANAYCERLEVTACGESSQWRSFVFKQGILQEDTLPPIPPLERCDIRLRLWPDFTILEPGTFTIEGTQEAIRSFADVKAGSTPNLVVTDARKG